ncbi:MAG: methyl-accepting chemotaxis protein [Chitinispirillia bacterium]|nr:methyl-accepting chemotaxis protein [Chitinispirillia bacterium]
MLDNVKVGNKLIAGFLLVAVLGAVVGIVGLTTEKKIANDIRELRNLPSPHSFISILNAHYQWRLGLTETLMNGSKFGGSLDPKTCALGKWVNSNEMKKVTDQKTLDLLKAVAAPHDYIHIEAAKVIQLLESKNKAGAMELYEKKILPAFEEVIAGLLAIGDRLDEVIEEQQEEALEAANASIKIIIVFMIASILLSIAIALFFARSISKPLNVAVDMLHELKSGHLGARLNMTRKDEIGIMGKAMDEFADDLQQNVVGTMRKIAGGDLSMFIEAVDAQDEIRPALKHTVVSLRNLIIEDGGKVLTAAANKDLSLRLQKEYKGEYAKMKENIDTVIQNLNEAMSQVAEAAAQVSSASGEISSGAQSLAEGSNTQASSLEEVGASLEETASMTKQNADNSNQAKILATEARSAANEGETSMKRMADAINQIKTSSDNTAKIVKTIDEIAFQTNLLALNAAVEAARAGEAGKGFAVVAEEVRNLAMRSAEAAKNTTTMIEESVKNADSGVKITEEVAKSLGQIVDRVGKMGDLIAEIAAASNEQAQGIEQVNTAVASMNHVTQQNAANSEESASAAEELSSQAAELQNMVSAFVLSSGGTGSRGGQSNRRGLPAPAARKQAALPAPKAVSAKSAKAMKSDQLIPLDDDDLSGF